MTWRTRLGMCISLGLVELAEAQTGWLEVAYPPEDHARLQTAVVVQAWAAVHSFVLTNCGQVVTQAFQTDIVPAGAGLVVTNAFSWPCWQCDTNGVRTNSFTDSRTVTSALQVVTNKLQARDVWAWDAYYAMSERTNVVGGAVQKPRFYRENREALVFTKDWLADSIGSFVRADTSRPPLVYLDWTNLYPLAAVPSNFLDYTPYRELNCGGIGYTNASTLTNSTTLDYGWCGVRKIFTNLVWTRAAGRTSYGYWETALTNVTCGGANGDTGWQSNSYVHAVDMLTQDQCPLLASVWRWGDDSGVANPFSWGSGSTGSVDYSYIYNLSNAPSPWLMFGGVADYPWASMKITDTRVFGTNYSWRYRFQDTLFPVDPDVVIPCDGVWTSAGNAWTWINDTNCWTDGFPYTNYCGVVTQVVEAGTFYGTYAYEAEILWQSNYVCSGGLQVDGQRQSVGISYNVPTTNLEASAEEFLYFVDISDVVGGSVFDFEWFVLPINNIDTPADDTWCFWTTNAPAFRTSMCNGTFITTNAPYTINGDTCRTNAGWRIASALLLLKWDQSTNGFRYR